jgi:PAS domain S-box-containing protein
MEPLDFAAIFDAVPESVLITDAELDAPGPRIVFVNRAFEALTGFSADAVLGRTPRLLQGPRTDRAVLRRMRSALERGAASEGETLNYRRDGREYRVRWHVAPYRRDPNGPITHFVATQRDVTDERRTQQLALGLALAQTQDGSMLLDRGGIIRFVNRAICEMCERAPEDLLGRRLLGSSLMPEVGITRGILRGIRIGGFWRGEVQVAGVGGRAVLQVAVTSLDEVGYVVAAHDMTERRRLEEIAASLNLTENLGMIFAGLRHELGNPVNSLKTALRVTRDNLDRFDRPKLEHYLDRMIDEVARVEYLLRSLRSYGALDGLEPTAVQLDDFLWSFSELARRDYESLGITLEVVCDAGLRVHADPRALHQVLLNLCNNAAHALSDSPRRRIAVLARHVRRGVELTVADTGVGMTAEQQSRLFQPFHTTKPHGTGMGLVIVRRLISQMRGTVSVDSTLGTGTSVRIHLEDA